MTIALVTGFAIILYFLCSYFFFVLFIVYDTYVLWLGVIKNNNNKKKKKSGDERDGAFLFRRSSVLMQLFNAILLHDSFESADHLGLRSFERLFSQLISCLLAVGIEDALGTKITKKNKLKSNNNSNVFGENIRRCLCMGSGRSCSKFRCDVKPCCRGHCFIVFGMRMCILMARY